MLTSLKDLVKQITYMKNYNPRKESKYIIDLYANNLYGWAMSQYLLYGKFKWVVNIECPDELRSLHNDYPLAPEKLEITYDM